MVQAVCAPDTGEHRLVGHTRLLPMGQHTVDIQPHFQPLRFESQRVQVQGRDELGQLGESFNQMAISLQKAEQNRRSMTSHLPLPARACCKMSPRTSVAIPGRRIAVGG